MLPSFLFLVGSWDTVFAEMNLFAGATLSVSVLRPVSARLVVRFVRSCSPRGVRPENPCERPSVIGRRSGRYAVFSGLLCETLPTIPRRPPLVSCAGPDLPGRVVSL